MTILKTAITHIPNTTQRKHAVEFHVSSSMSMLKMKMRRNEKVMILSGKVTVKYSVIIYHLIIHSLKISEKVYTTDLHRVEYSKY